MKIIRIDNRDYVLKYSTKIINLMNIDGITLKSIKEDLENSFNTTKLNKAFYYGLKAMQKDITENEAYDLLDKWIEEGIDGEEIQTLIIGELMKAMGFTKQFKEAMEQKRK